MNFRTRCNIPGYELFNKDYLTITAKHRELTKKLVKIIIYRGTRIHHNATVCKVFSTSEN